MSAAEGPPLSDLDELLTRTPRLWNDLRGARVFMTGGTGFTGKWLLESLLHADRVMGLGATIVALTRDKAAFHAHAPHLASDRRLSLHHGDVRSYTFPSGEFTHVVHAAAETSVCLEKDHPALLHDVIVSGTRRTIDFAKQCGARKFLFTSSGAVYGPQPPDLEHASEDSLRFDSPLIAPSAYAEGKRAAERMCTEAARQGLDATIARGFAFVGPGLPLSGHFAIGNFIRDAVAGGPIIVDSDGTSYRSYLYAADMAEWLWTIMLKGEAARAYNVGSERRITIAQLAELVRRIVAPAAVVDIRKARQPGTVAAQYVPSTSLIREELGIREVVGLEEAIRRTANWARRHTSN